MPTKALIPLPTQGIPNTNKCVVFFVPDSAEFFGMFWGALYQLTAWNSYYRDEAHSAKAVADTWKVVIDEARLLECSSLCSFDWSLDQDFSSPQSSPSDLFFVSSLANPTYRTWFGFTAVGGGGLTNMDIVGFDNDTGDPVGGPIGSLFIHSNDNTALGGSISWIDCAGLTHIVGGGASAGVQIQDFDFVHLVIAVGKSCHFCIVQDGNHC